MTIDLKREGAVGIVLMDAPPVNAYDTDMLRAVQEAVHEARRDDAIRCLVVKSAIAKFFSAGADIKTLQQSSAAEFANLLTVHLFDRHNPPRGAGNERLIGTHQIIRLQFGFGNGHFEPTGKRMDDMLTRHGTTSALSSFVWTPGSWLASFFASSRVPVRSSIILINVFPPATGPPITT